MNPIEPKFTRVSLTVNLSETKWTQVKLSEPKWTPGLIIFNMSDPEWAQVNPSVHTSEPK